MIKSNQDRMHVGPTFPSELLYQLMGDPQLLNVVVHTMQQGWAGGEGVGGSGTEPVQP